MVTATPTRGRRKGPWGRILGGKKRGQDKGINDLNAMLTEIKRDLESGKGVSQTALAELNRLTGQNYQTNKINLKVVKKWYSKTKGLKKYDKTRLGETFKEVYKKHYK